MNVFESYHVYTMASFSCNHGYSLSGSDSSICLDSKTWSKPAPSCLQGVSYIVSANQWQFKFTIYLFL